MNDNILNEAQFRVCQALMILQAEERYSASIAAWIMQEYGTEPNPGALLNTMRRLEKRGYVKPSWGEPLPERGGKRRRYYAIEPSGRVAVNRTERQFASRVPGALVPGAA